MKKLTTPLLATLLALSAASRLAAADPESAFGLAPSAAPQLQPSAPSNLPLIPEAPQPVEKPKAKAAGEPHGDRTAIEEDKLKARIALREAKVKAERDPELQALMAKALVAHTDFEQRKLFVAYYSGLVDRMAKFYPGMTKEQHADLLNRYTGRYNQTRIRPTIDPAIARAQH